MTPIPITDVLEIVKPYIPQDKLNGSNSSKKTDKNGHQKHILIVDDDVVFLRMMTNALKDTRMSLLTQKQGYQKKKREQVEATLSLQRLFSERILNMNMMQRNSVRFACSYKLVR